MRASSKILIVATTVLIASLFCIGMLLMSYVNGRGVYDDLRDYIEVEDKANPELVGAKVDWDTLREINPDIVGWVYVPDTPINYPIVWRENDDEYYLHRDFRDQMSGIFGAEFGCIGLSGVNSPREDIDGDGYRETDVVWEDQNLVLYGHHMNDGSMFAVLQDLADEDMFDAHHRAYVYTPNGNYALTLICIDKVDAHVNEVIMPNFTSEEDYRTYLADKYDNALIRCDDFDVDSVKQSFAMYTCSEPDNSNRIFAFFVVDEFAPVG